MEQKELKELLASMTIQEKIGQLVQLPGEFFGESDMATGPQQSLGIEPWVSEMAGSVLNVAGAERVAEIQKRHLEHSRIPLLFMADIIYGYKTVYPIPLAMACSWDPAMVKQCMKNTAMEAAPDGVHVTFAPMVDVVRDARWGRCMESPGEDPFLNGVFAKAMVEGFQEGEEPSGRLASCAKHFAAYGAAEAGREYNTVDMSRWRLMQEYLPPYQAAVEAGCELVMTSFNTVEGVPATANRWLMEEVLRGQWGFDGVLITDYAAIQELIAHGVAEDKREAAYLAINAGVDIDMNTSCYANQLQPLLEEGRISMEKIDRAVWRILTLKNRLGLFENPLAGPEAKTAAERGCCAAFCSQSRKMAEESVVLLKNDSGTLPLSRGQKVAVIGPYADNQDMLGLWAVYGDKSRVVTLRTAMEEIQDPQNLTFARGCRILEDISMLGGFGAGLQTEDAAPETEDELLKRAIELAKWADVVVFALGEHIFQSGEGGSRTEPGLPNPQVRLVDALAPYGKKSVALVFNGRPLVLTDLAGKVDAILECWFPGTEGARAIADILYGKVNPSGRLTTSFPYAVGQIPIYYSAFRTGRPMDASRPGERFVSHYLDCPNEPLFPFGYGLSYHQADYGEIALSSAVLTPGNPIQAKIAVRNNSERPGDEVVQLYIHDVAASVVRPVKELKGFQRIHLEAGEEKVVTFEINEKMLEFHNQNGQKGSEEGRFDLYIGKSSMEWKEASFELKKEG